VLGAAICIAALALAVELVLAGVQWFLTPRGLRVKAADDPALTLVPVVADLA
jgi:ABC-type proline/glycine betaine transport system permease subunit